MKGRDVDGEIDSVGQEKRNLIFSKGYGKRGLEKIEEFQGGNIERGEYVMREE